MDIKQLLNKMSLEEKVGQLFQIGFDGTEVTPAVKEMIEDYHVGGIIYFRRNIESLEQIATLSNQLQELACNGGRGLPLLISTDQEGGTVTRVTGGTHFPGNMTIGATGDPTLAGKAGRAIAQELKAVGINMDLAPVLDVNNNPGNPVIGVRSYGEDPEKVAELGVSFIEEMQDEGVIACGKHFPGHGDTDTDSHLALPIIKHSRDRLEEIEFYPFQKAIEAGLDSIMTAHVNFPSMESDEEIPATLSRNVLIGLLREEMNFDGLIITDCMEMNAIVSTFGTVEGAIMTLEAGSDMVLVSHILEKQKGAIKAVSEAVREGRISEERIDRSVLRILRLKKKRIGLDDYQKADHNQTDLDKNSQVAYQIARKGVTLVKDEDNLLPISCSEDKVMVIDFNMGRVSLVEDDREHHNPFVSCLKDEGVEVVQHTITEGGTQLPQFDGYDRVIVCTYNAIQSKEQVRIVKNLEEMEVDFIVLALRNPYDLNGFEEISTFMTTYDYSGANLKVAGEIITGKIEAAGVLPVTLD